MIPSWFWSNNNAEPTTSWQSINIPVCRIYHSDFDNHTVFFHFLCVLINPVRTIYAEIRNISGYKLPRVWKMLSPIRFVKSFSPNSI